MIPSKTLEFDQTWGDLDLEKAPLPELFRVIDKRLQEGSDINAQGVRDITQEETIHKKELFTLADKVISLELHKSLDFYRGRELMDFLRSRGAKPASALGKFAEREYELQMKLSDLEIQKQQVWSELIALRRQKGR